MRLFSKGNCAARKLQGRPVVVVVGGGYAGIAVAKKLDTKFNVVMIDRKDYFFHNIGAPRGAVVQGYAPSQVVPYGKLLKNGTVIQGNVTGIRDGCVTLEGVDTLVPYDYLVIATGSSYAFPFKFNELHRQDVQRHYDAVTKAVEEARHIAVIGGGPVGVEMSGEILAQHPRKMVTLIHGGSTLLSGPMFPRLAAPAKERLSRLGGDRIDIMLEHRAVFDDDEKKESSGSQSTYLVGETTIRTTCKGEPGPDVRADLVFFCRGASVRNSAYDDFGDAVDEHDRLKVDGHFAVEGHDNVFAIGDCTTQTAEPRMAYFAGLQGTYLASHITKLDAGCATSEYSPSSPAMFVPMGT